MKAADQLHSPAQDVDNAPDFGCQSIHDDWKFRAPIAGRSGDMTYGYYNKSLVPIFHVRLRGADGKPYNFRASFQAVSSVIYNGLSAAGGQLEVELPLPDLGHDYIEQSVFVKIIEIAEQGQQGRKGWVPSIVRLQSLDFCPHRNTQTLDAPFAFDEGRRGVSNGKLERPFVGRRINSVLMDSCGIDKMVKGAPQIVNTISDDAGPTVQIGEGFNVFDNKAVAGTIGIDLSADDVRVAVNPSPYFSVEHICMFFGPSEFEPATSKLRSEHTLVLCTDSRVQDNSLGQSSK
jgi:hypothetical protein